MPAKGTTRLTPAQKAAVAAGRVSGKSIKQIAKDAGISPSTASHVVTKPEIKGIIDRIFAENSGMMAGLMAGVVESLLADIAPGSKLTAEQRYTARTQAVTVLQLGQPKAPEVAPTTGPGAAPGGGVFLGDMLAVYRSVIQQSGAE